MGESYKSAFLSLSLSVLPGLPSIPDVVHPEFVTGSGSVSATTERHYNKPILIMTNERPSRGRERPKPFEKVTIGPQQTYAGQDDLEAVGGPASDRPHFDYDYYDENDDQFIGKIRAQVSGQSHWSVDEWLETQRERDKLFPGTGLIISVHPSLHR